MSDTESKSTTFDLSELFDRDKVKRRPPSTALLEIRHKQELSIMQRHELDALITKINALDAKPDKTDEDAASGSEMLHELAAIVAVDAPDDLEDWECAAIFGFWLARSVQEAGTNPPPRSRSRKSGSASGSKRSTAAPRKSGSTARRGS